MFAPVLVMTPVSKLMPAPTTELKSPKAVAFGEFLYPISDGIKENTCLNGFEKVIGTVCCLVFLP
nr:MAG TPA: hypothetical protein [Caudoviricetes sp.]